MKISKIQTEILATVAKRGSVCVSSARGRGQKGGKIDCGRRDVNAALALEAAGLLVRESYDRDMDIRHGHAVTYTCLVFVAPRQEG
jgi:hypothetical protein